MNDIWVPSIPDSPWINSDHIPMYIDDISCYSWGVKNSGAYPKEGMTQRRGSVAYEIQHCLPDNHGNNFPPVEKCVLACSSKGCSNSKRGGVLVDNFKGHIRGIVKEYTLSFKDQTCGYNFCEFQIMARRITPKAQPIDVITGKILKGCYREECDLHMLDYPLNENGQPILLVDNCVLNSV
eukprot:8643913-Ditylum_brightwellii.AAC.1